MTFQSRTSPYRTHQLSESKSLSPGRYAGRVFDLDHFGEEQEVHLLLNDQPVSLKTHSTHQFTIGELLTFDIDKMGRLIPIETLFTPLSHASPHTGDVMRWRQLGKSRMAFLKSRHQILQSIRAFFDQQEFLEVDTPLLVKAPSPENQFAPFQVGTEFLITSPEFQMKRMLVGGFEKIYQLTACFRGKEIGNRHNPEFTMLEWYRAFEGLDSMAHDLKSIVTTAMNRIHPNQTTLHVGASQVQLETVWEKATVAELMDHYLGIDILKAETGLELKKQATAQGWASCLEGVQDHYETVFFRLWDRFEQKLGQKKPICVYDWPLPLASLAQKRQNDPRVSERMELYVGGIEIANGFGELTAPDEQRQRFEANLRERLAEGMEPVPLDESFLKSLEQGMPPSAGMAMGIDRLVMLITGASHIRDVLCFAFDER